MTILLSGLGSSQQVQFSLVLLLDFEQQNRLQRRYPSGLAHIVHISCQELQPTHDALAPDFCEVIDNWALFLHAFFYCRNSASQSHIFT
uniref:Uncharacterized protein n=1 Tax=Physcomitrium patens TaxID=3218 RepID=A0A2K1KEG1_PHYPA|nr:hypothetical protein PHYPA_008513 [Physcomitrium patens]